MAKEKIKKILVTGCGGMLGSSVYSHLNEKGYNVKATDIDLNEKWLSFLDVRDYDKAKKISKRFSPDIILHLAALTSLEYCEDHIKEAFKTNYLGTKNMAGIAKESGIPLVYVSTAGVFDGKKERYSEEDIPNPINVYGRTKFYGEIAVQNTLEKYFITRAGWMIGGGKKDKKFVSYILSQIKQGKREFNIVKNMRGTPTYTRDFARNLELLFNTDFYGLYHMACCGETDRVEIAKHIFDVLGVKDAKINEVDSSFFAKQFPVARAACERMIDGNLDKKKINKMRPWKLALQEYLEKEWGKLIINKKV